MRNFLISSFTRIATYATIIVIFTHNVLFDREVACTCQDQKVHCNVYIIMPIFIIFLLVLWNDKNFNGTWRAYCYMKKRRICKKICYLIVQIVKALVIGLLWVISVLFDGDWYACCQNGLPKNDTQIPCKTNRTPKEQATIDHLKNESKVIGLGVLLGLLFLIVCYSLLKWCNSCSCEDCKDCKYCKDYCDCSKEECSDCWQKCSSYIDGDGLYELIIIKEEEDAVNEILKEKVKDALKKKVNDILDGNGEDKYMDCYKPAQKVIELWPEKVDPFDRGRTGVPKSSATI